MTRPISLLFPGQGSQATGMLSQDLISTYKDIIDEASNLTKIDFISLINNDPENCLNKTSFTQPALLLTSYLYFLKFKSIVNINPTYMAGHSLGEYSALVASDSIDFFDALELVHKRGLLMESAPKGLMAAIMGLELSNLKDICSSVQTQLESIVSCANLNSHSQTVIAGSELAVNRVCSIAKESGAKRAIVLNVSVASHCELMNEPASLFSDYLDKTNITIPSTNVIHNYSAETSRNESEIKKNLVNQLTSSVKWFETMDEIKKNDSIVIECGPGKVLQGLAKSNGISDILSITTDDFESKLKDFYE